MEQVPHCYGDLEMVYHSAFHPLLLLTSTLTMIHPYDSLLKATIIEKGFFPQHNFYLSYGSVPFRCSSKACQCATIYNTRALAWDHLNGMQPFFKVTPEFTSQNVSYEKNLQLRFTVDISSSLFGQYFSDVLRPCPAAISPLKPHPRAWH